MPISCNIPVLRINFFAVADLSLVLILSATISVCIGIFSISNFIVQIFLFDSKNIN